MIFQKPACAKYNLSSISRVVIMTKYTHWRYSKWDLPVSQQIDTIFLISLHVTFFPSNYINVLISYAFFCETSLSATRLYMDYICTASAHRNEETLEDATKLTPAVLFSVFFPFRWRFFYALHLSIMHFKIANIIGFWQEKDGNNNNNNHHNNQPNALARLFFLPFLSFFIHIFVDFPLRSHCHSHGFLALKQNNPPLLPECFGWDKATKSPHLLREITRKGFRALRQSHWFEGRWKQKDIGTWRFLFAL